LRVAIVGAGAAACYAADELLARGDVEVEILERLATPYGLIRGGVAPDHLETKEVGLTFGPRFVTDAVNFYFNVEVGNHITHEELLRHHHAVIYAVGAFEERRLDIPGEALRGSHPASEFVAWYNGHPDYADMEFDLSGQRAVVVGNGNVALDVARILVSDPSLLGETDIADHALDSLHAQGIEEVVVIGRRGPLQATFTTLELRELGDLEAMADVDVVIDPADFADITDDQLEAAGRTVKQNIRVLRGYAATEPRNAKRRIVFRFQTSPVEIKGTDRVSSIVLGHNELVADAGGRVVAKDTGIREELPAQLVIRAVGYRGVPTPGLPFDERTGTIPHSCGRVQDSRNEYVVGWIKRGPSGVIGSNKKDSADTVDTLLADLATADLRDVGPDYSDELVAWLLSRQPKLVTDDHWHAIDAHERALGEPLGRPRVKLTSVAELLRVGHG
jgi:ferredoxin--NADP+ reductase